MPSHPILFQLLFLLPRAQISTFSWSYNCLWCYSVNTSDIKQGINNLLLSTQKKEASSQNQQFLGLLLPPNPFYLGSTILVLAFPSCTTFLPSKISDIQIENNFRNRNSTGTMAPTRDNKAKHSFMSELLWRSGESYQTATSHLPLPALQCLLKPPRDAYMR